MSILRKAGSDIQVVSSFNDNARPESQDTINSYADGTPFVRLIAVKDAIRYKRDGSLATDPKGKVLTYNAIVPVVANPLFDATKPESDDNPKEIERYDLALVSWDFQGRLAEGQMGTYKDFSVFEDGVDRLLEGALHEKYREMKKAGATEDELWPALANLFPTGGIIHGFYYTAKNRYGGTYGRCYLDFVKDEAEHTALKEERAKQLEADKAAKAA